MSTETSKSYRNIEKHIREFAEYAEQKMMSDNRYDGQGKISREWRKQYLRFDSLKGEAVEIGDGFRPALSDSGIELIRWVQREFHFDPDFVAAGNAVLSRAHVQRAYSE